MSFEDGHGGQRTGAHGDVWKLVGTAVSVDSEEVAACGVDTSYNEVGANVALVTEQMLLKHGHDGGDARLASGRQGVQFDVGRDESGGEFGVGSSTSAGAPDLRGDVMQLLAVLSDAESVLRKR